MKQQMRLMISDDGPVQDALMAKAKEAHDRTCMIGVLTNQGHIRVLEDNDPLNIRLVLEDEVFAEPRDVFPSAVLIARLQLAINAGRSERNLTVQTIVDAADQMSRYKYQYGGIAGQGNHGRTYKLDARSLAMEQGYANVAKITAKVTRNVRKGLRP